MTINNALRRFSRPSRGPKAGRRQEPIAVGEVEAHVFNCPGCGRPLATGAPVCPGCGRSGHAWCAECDRRIRTLPLAACSLCGRRLAHGIACRTCSIRPGFFPVASWAHYGPPLDRILTHLKYRADRSVAEQLALRLTDVVRAAGWRATCVVPVPLGKHRQRQRGYNQVGLIAHALGKHLDMPVLPSALARLRETPSQVGLSPAERRQNVAGAFGAEPSQIRERTSLLLDDVYTTGATLAACAEALREAGAPQVFGLTVARA